MILDTGKPIPRSAWVETLDYLWGIFAAAASIALGFALWQYASMQVGDLLLPAPLPVLSRAWSLLHMPADLWLTLWRSALGVGLSLLLGIGLGLLAGHYRTIGLMCRPIISILLGMPPIIWVVLAMFWVGIGSGSTVFTIVITSVPLTFASAMQTRLSIDSQLDDMLKAYRLRFWQRFRALYGPHCLQHLLPACSVAVGLAIKVGIMAELLGANDGLGAQIAQARAYIDTELVMAHIVLVLGIIFSVEYGLIEPLRRLFLPRGHL